MPLSKKQQLQEKISSVKHQQEEKKAKQLAKKLKLPYINLFLTPVDRNDILVLPEEKAKQAKLLVMKRKGKDLMIAASNPEEPETQKVLKELEQEGYNCSLYIASLRGIKEKWKAYEFYSETPPLKDVFPIEKQELEQIKNDFNNIENLKQAFQEEKSTTEFLKILFGSAVNMQASDIHLEPGKKKVGIRYRVDGMLQGISSLSLENYNRIITRIKTLSRLILNVHEKSQDGRFTIKIKQEEDKEIAVRVSILPGPVAETIVLRLLGINVIKLELPELGVREELYNTFQAQLSKPNGMILTTGPTGSGKTTTLYACLKQINNPQNKIITIEDPIEYELEGVTQTQINERKGQTFAESLPSIVRQDPDALMVGEIRDEASADAAVQFSLTGHLVLSTLHTNDSAGALPRLIKFGINPSALSSAINLVIAQRLVRQLCPDCKEEYQPTPSEKKAIEKVFSLISPKSGVNIPNRIGPLYKPKGCSKCHGIGYKGRLGVFEMFTVSDAIEELIHKEAPSYKFRIKAMEEGMITMLQDALLKATQGVTSIEEIKRVIGSPSYIEQLYGSSIKSLLSRNLIINQEIQKWLEDLKFEPELIQKKTEQVDTDEIINYLAAAALKFKATDIHLEAGEESFTVRFRIEGMLEKVAEIKKRLFLSTVSKVKDLAGMKIDVHQKAQDGRFSIEYENLDKAYDVRVSAIPSGYGESVILRILRPDIEVLSFKELGLRPSLTQTLKKSLKSPHGIIFVTGPTSSGKTTTLYAILNKLNRPEVKIFTVEDPIEYRLDGIIQTQVDQEENYTFANAIKSLLRQNPNIIMLGEIRDEETAKAAIQASLTGHLVLTTLHTNNTIEAIPRLKALGIEPKNISSALIAVMAQRLVRTLCPECKEPKEISGQEKQQIEESLSQIPEKHKQNLDLEQIKLFKAVGCEKCRDHGYSGQTAIFEVLKNSKKTSEQIYNSEDPAEIRKTAQEQEMLTLYQDGLLKALEGTTTLEEVNRVVNQE